MMIELRLLGSRLWSALSFDPSLYEEVEKVPRALWQAAGIVVAAGAARGVSPMFEAGWAPIAGHCVAGLLIWLVCSSLVWNVAHRIFGFSEGFFELARVYGFASVPLVGLWLTALPIGGSSLWLSVALHGLALISVVIATRAALSISMLRALAICVLSVSAGALLLFILGLFLAGSPAAAVFDPLVSSG